MPTYDIADRLFLWQLAEPQRPVLIGASVDTPNPAIHGRLKTGHRGRPRHVASYCAVC